MENRLEAVYTGTAYSQTLQMAAAYDGDGNRVYQMNYNPDKDEDFSDYYCTYNSCDYKGTGIRLRVEGEVSSAERELLSLITASGAITDSSYELIEYINDVNREYAEVLVEQNINGTLDTAYVYGAAIGAGSDRLSLDHFDSTGYYLYDPRGSVTGITNEEGQIYQSYRYSVFGEITFGASQYENEYTYNGESYNPNIKSQYLRFHIFGMEWTSEQVEYFLDGESVCRYRKADDTEDRTENSWPYDKPYYLILNTAMGGLGGPVVQEALPFVMEVGYVRVYQKKRRKLK